uniref:Multiple inositol polyphosphate phosphatase 1 isoform X1 n=1 Tax=Rhizophora mucronata TaxID=61149 RepID=A0A2P2L8Z7_RHIMU
MRMAMATATVAVSVLLVLSSFTPSKSDPDFDVRQHLSTVTRYDFVKDIVNTSFVPSDIPNGCRPIHINLVVIFSPQNK